MSKATRRAAALAKVTGEKEVRIELYDMEGVAVIDHVNTVGGFVPKGHDDFAALRQMLVEMDLLLWFDGLKNGSLDRQRIVTQMCEPGGFSVVALQPATVRFFLEKFTAGDMAASVAVSMAPLIQRVKDAKMGAYKLPADAEAKSAKDDATE